jgi:hypothetical protein
MRFVKALSPLEAGAAACGSPKKASHHRETKSAGGRITTDMPGRVLLLALALSGAVLGQQSGSQDRPEALGATATRGPQSPQWRSAEC